MRYRKKPIIIEAVQYYGDNYEVCENFCPDISECRSHDGTPYLIIPTLEGDMKCSIGDYIIKGIKGEFYPCKPDIFEASYELEGR